MLFTKKARDKLYKSSSGVPRLVNILCHKALLVAYGRGDGAISHKIMETAIQDTASVTRSYKPLLITMGVGLVFIVGLVALFLFDGAI
jgi:MSHA biogenesis protein MshM